MLYTSYMHYYMLFEHSCVALCRANGAKATIVSVFTGAVFLNDRE